MQSNYNSIKGFLVDFNDLFQNSYLIYVEPTHFDCSVYNHITIGLINS